MELHDYTEGEVEELERIVSWIDTSSCKERVEKSPSEQDCPLSYLVKPSSPSSPANKRARLEDFSENIQDETLSPLGCFDEPFFELPSYIDDSGQLQGIPQTLTLPQKEPLEDVGSSQPQNLSTERELGADEALIRRKFEQEGATYPDGVPQLQSPPEKKYSTDKPSGSNNNNGKTVSNGSLEVAIQRFSFNSCTCSCPPPGYDRYNARRSIDGKKDVHLGSFLEREKAWMAEDLITYHQTCSNKMSKIAKKLNFPDWIPNWSVRDRQRLCYMNIDKLRVYIARQSNATNRVYTSRNVFGCPGVGKHGSKFEVKIKNSKMLQMKDRLFFGSFDTPEMATKPEREKRAVLEQVADYVRLLTDGPNAKTSKDRDCSDDAVREMIKFIRSGPGRDLVVHESWQHLICLDDDQSEAASDNKLLE